MQQIALQALVTKTSTFSGVAVDISGIAGDWTLIVSIEAASPGLHARFAFQDNAGLAAPTFVVAGSLSKSAPLRLSFRRRDHVGVPFGIMGATLQLSLVEITGLNPSISYSAWIEAA